MNSENDEEVVEFWKDVLDMTKDLNACMLECKENDYFKPEHAQLQYLIRHELDLFCKFMMVKEEEEEGEREKKERRRKKRKKLSVDDNYQCPGLWWRKNEKKRRVCKNKGKSLLHGSTGNVKDPKGKLLCKACSQAYYRDKRKKEEGLQHELLTDGCGQ